MLYPTLLVKIGNGAAEAFLLCGIRRGHDLPASCCVAEKLGFFRRHALFRAVVALVVYRERRRIPLGKDREMIPKKIIWEGLRVEGSGEGDVVWDVIGEGVGETTSLPENVWGKVDCDEAPGGCT